MTLEEFLNIHNEVSIRRSGRLHTTAYTVTSTNGIQITIGHLTKAQDNLELALNNLSLAIKEKERKDAEALEAARKAKIKRFIKF